MSHRHNNPPSSTAPEQGSADPYGVLKGRPTAGKIADPTGPGKPAHFHILVETNSGEKFDVAVNVLSQQGSEVLYFIDHNFQPAKASALESLPEGFSAIDSSAGGAGLGLDFVMQDLVRRSEMQILPENVALSPSAGDGADANDLHDEIDDLVQRAIAEQGAVIYAFGRRFADDNSNQYFDFTPDQGVHEIHMNQGNPPGRFGGENGRFSDGAVFAFFPSTNRWLAAFVAFQTQSWDNDDQGNPKGAAAAAPAVTDEELAAADEVSEGGHVEAPDGEEGAEHPEGAGEVPVEHEDHAEGSPEGEGHMEGVEEHPAQHEDYAEGSPEGDQAPVHEGGDEPAVHHEGLAEGAPVDQSGEPAQEPHGLVEPVESYIHEVKWEQAVTTEAIPPEIPSHESPPEIPQQEPQEASHQDHPAEHQTQENPPPYTGW